MTVHHGLRRRRVRFEYPVPVRVLACLAAQRLSCRAVARAMDLPLSTLYRWIAAGDGGADQSAKHDIEKLVVCCEQLGFAYRHALRAAGLPLAQGAPSSAPSSASEVRLQRAELGDDALEHTRDLIERCYFQSLSCDELASYARLSKFHFIKRFRERFGVTPHRYRQQVRIEHARRLLRIASPSLAAIATALGFNDVSTFMKAFRAQCGESVSHYVNAQPPLARLA